MYCMQFSLTVWPGSVQLFDFLFKAIIHHDIVSKYQQNYHCTRFSFISTLQTNQTHAKQSQRKKAPNTAHCRQSVKQTAQRAEKVVEHTVPEKKQKWSAERYALNADWDKRHMGSRASNARRNGNGTDEKSSEQCATERKRDVRESERKTRNTTKRDGGKERAGGTMLADRSKKNSTKQPSRNFRQT